MRSKRPLLTRARKAAGLTQEELAYRLGVDRSTVGRWEAGETEPQPWLRPKLGNALGVTRAALSTMLIVDGEKNSSAIEVSTGLDHGLDLDERGMGTRIVSSSTALDMVSVSANYRRAYRSLPAKALLVATKAHLSLILSPGPASQRSPVGGLLVRAVGESAVLAAALLGADLGRKNEAERFLALAYDAAKENEDADLTAVILACRAFLKSFNGGNPIVAAEFADAAVQVASMRHGQRCPNRLTIWAGRASGHLISQRSTHMRAAT